MKSGAFHSGNLLSGRFCLTISYFELAFSKLPIGIHPFIPVCLQPGSLNDACNNHPDNVISRINDD